MKDFFVRIPVLGEKYLKELEKLAEKSKWAKNALKEAKKLTNGKGYLILNKVIYKLEIVDSFRFHYSTRIRTTVKMVSLSPWWWPRNINLYEKDIPGFIKGFNKKYCVPDHRVKK